MLCRFMALLLLQKAVASKITLDDDESITTAESKAATEEIPCFDKELSCNRNICRQHPEIGKDKCAKTCGHCNKQQHDGGHPDKNTYGLAYFKNRKIYAHMDNLCFDRKLDCTSEYCRDQYQHARDECAKTCGFCTPEKTARDQPKTTPKPTRKGFGSLDSICFDRDLMCTQEICRDYRDTARENCAKTCGYC